MQVPRKIQVSLGATMITDYLPQNGGKFYTLAKQFGENGVPQKGSDNWLSDMGTNAEVAETQKANRDSKFADRFKRNKDKKNIKDIPG